MNKDLLDEIKEEIDFFSKCGFYDIEEILETIEDEFIDFDLDLDLIHRQIEEIFNKHQENSNSSDVVNLIKAFDNLTKESIVSIHNCGYDTEEAVEDAFEIYTHLINNDYSSIGFCFYTLSDLEEVFENKTLAIYYGSFDLEDKDKQNQLEDLIENTFKGLDFNIEKREEQFIIKDFNWQKVYDNKDYSMEGAYGDFIKFNNKDG